MEPDCSAPADGTEWVTCVQAYTADVNEVVAAVVAVAAGIAILFAAYRVFHRAAKLAAGER
jgi:hypothetical protein